MTTHLYAEMYPVPERIDAERLYLRAPQMGDGVIVQAALEESFEQLHQWMPWAQQRQSLAETETFGRESAAKFRAKEEFNFLMFRKSDDRYLGNLGVHSIVWSVPRFEIGYWLRTSEQGHGYITEAVLAVCDTLFSQQKAERIEIRCEDGNQKSAAVAERAGFALEAIFKHNRRNYLGELVDSRIYVKFPNDAFRPENT